MALLSPGVQVSVTDESFSTGAGPGTVPLVLIATAQDKTTPDGLSTAVGTTAANANNLYLISSQRELLQTFGNPDFNEVGGSAQNGYPLNEYGLLAAYSYLGVANRAYVIRADIDLEELEPSTAKPTSDPADNTVWVDLNNFVPGLFESDGTAWLQQTVTVVIESTDTFDTSSNTAGFSVGDYIAVFYNERTDGTAVDATNGIHLEYYRLGSLGTWQRLDAATLGGTIQIYWAPHYNVPAVGTAGDVWLKTTTPNGGLAINVKQFDSALGQFVDLGSVPVVEDPTAYYASVNTTSIAAGTIVGFVDSIGTVGEATADASLDVVFQEHNGASNLVATAENINQAISSVDPDSFDITVGSIAPVTVTFAQDVASNDANLLATEINIQLDGTALDGIVVAGTTTNSAGATVLNFTVASGQDLTLSNGVSMNAASLGFTGTFPLTFTNFTNVDTNNTYSASVTQPTGSTAFGTYWYDPSFTVDLLRKGTTGWDEITDDIFVQSDEPTTGVSDGDIWVETDSGTAYPVIYRRISSAWVLVDNTDQTSPLGIIFADARDDGDLGIAYGTDGDNNGGSNPSPDLDSDAPDPALYPSGTLLWNTRASGRNVKVWTDAVADHTNVPTATLTPRWVSASGNANDGSLITGAAAQKQVVIEALASTLTANEDIRNDTIFYNLIAAPGFPELMDEMLNLNVDRKEQAFVIGDTPFSLASDTTSLQEWSSNLNNAAGNGDDGLVSADPYLGVYYPSGLATNVDGSEVVVPASHMVMRQMAYNDQVAYPWFAPAGFSRGTISNATAVGYLDSEDEFVTVTLNEGQRDTLYNNNVNPIATLPGRGIVIWGQKTRNATAGALDRVNVARLVNYIRFQADVLAQPFLFEPNDRVTRDAVKEAFDSFLAELVTLRGVTDFLVVVDESNNTPARIDRNELWVDIAIQPTKAVEFIYIPIRLRNTGADLQPGA